jgi:tRNA/rRNA methyltransferase
MHQIDGEHHVSMNLGQAVAVCLYELVRGAEALPSSASPSSEEPPADAASLERITTLLARVLEATEYTRRHAANSDAAQVRRLVRRIGTSPVDAPIWMGILRQVLWKLGLQAHGEEGEKTDPDRPTSLRS